MSVIASDLISIVIPTRNRCERLRRALESARTQSWKNTEIIVIDDASSDGTAVLMENMSQADARIRTIRNDTPQGGGGARNSGIAAAHGKFVAFLDDDDQWFPHKLERQHAMLAAHPEAAAVSCSFNLSTPGGAERTLTLQPPRDFQQLLRANCLGGASVCFTTRAHLLECGGFDPGLRSGQDWDLWLKLYARGPVLVCAEPLVHYVTHDDQRITGNLDSAYHGRRRIHLRYKALMERQTRHHSLCELFFFRQVLFRSSWKARFGGLLSLIVAAHGANKLRFPYRLAKIALQNGLHRSAP
jgi:glycosyltransferase involved in cell wall biosynthesis